MRKTEVTQAYAVFCGIDVGKGEHHAVGLDPNGKRLFDKALPNDESRLRAVFDQLAAHVRDGASDHTVFSISSSPFSRARGRYRPDAEPLRRG